MLSFAVGQSVVKQFAYSRRSYEGGMLLLV